MTVTELAKRFDLQPKDITAFVQANATFPVKRNFQTGEITIPDNVDIANFIAPLLGKAYTEKQQKIASVVESKIEQERQARCQSEQEHIFAIEKLKKTGVEGYYQYKVISLLDIGGLFSSNSGRVNTETMTQTLNELGMEGWHLVTAYSNELGKNALSGGAGGFIMGTNSTVDENILIFERFVKF